MTAATHHGKYLLIEGSAVRGRAMLRMRDISGDRLELLEVRDRLAKLEGERNLMQGLLDILPAYIWMRDNDGRLRYVNNAYAKAVELQSPQAVLAAGVELLERGLREQARKAHKQNKPYVQTAHGVVGSERHLLSIHEVASPHGTFGIAYDLQPQELLRLEIERLKVSHGRTLDQLSTAVAIFDGASHLQFFNAAYRQLWQLDAPFLEQKPLDGEILDRLRVERKLPEEPDFRKWKSDLFAHYNAVEPSQFMWYLPKGQILRVVITPNAQGGVTYLYDDITNYFQLEQQFNSLMRTQNETLDSLKEGVGVFGTDGRLKLFNLAFQDLWQIDAKQLSGRPHIDEVVRLFSPLYHDENFWLDLCAAITGVHDKRVGFERALPRVDDTVLDCTTTPLPDGGTLVTFVDVTAKVSVERALTDRNQALLDAERLRSTFLQHVSYELRTPLTNIIGFTQFLEDESVVSLNAKQREYVGHVMTSSSALFAIINDILDLATIDAGAMELNLSNIDVRETIHAAMEGLADRITEGGYDIQVIVSDDIGLLQADAKRVRQVLFNVMSNAIGFSDPGASVMVAALRRGDEIVLKVSDQGRGIPPEILAKVFERFETHTAGTRHRGLGLGLSIVRSIVELHGGRVMIDSVPYQGTVVTCVFPVKAKDKKTLSENGEKQAQSFGLDTHEPSALSITNLSVTKSLPQKSA